MTMFKRAMGLRVGREPLYRQRPFFDFSPGTLDLDIRRGRRLASPLTMGKKRNKAIRPKDLKRALKACQFVFGLTKRQAAMVILDFLADRGAFGPALFAECKRLVKEKGLACRCS